MLDKNQLQEVKQSTKSLQDGKRSQPWTLEEKKSLAVIIGRIFDLQKQFGKKNEQLSNIVEGFCWALSPYHPSQVIQAFGEYILNHSDMPTPYDIRQIIDPIPQPWVPDKSYYYKLQEIFKRDGPFGLNNEEIEYIRTYEDHMLKERKSRIP